MNIEPLLRSADRFPMELRLSRDLVRTIKRGHPWVYGDNLLTLPKAPAGAQAILLDHKAGREVARGYYDPQCPIAFRSCEVDGKPLDEGWARRRLERALTLRQQAFASDTTGFRLSHGEGDGLPGLVIDIYDRYAVMQLDGAGPEGFWNASGVAQWLTESLALTGVFCRARERGAAGKLLAGTLPENATAEFLEHGIRWTADLVKGQKTGFFLDQRENRHLVRGLSQGRRLLNLFAYTGGFSVAAGLGGASHVTTVDLAKPAIEAANHHWSLNGLDPANHVGVAEDVFRFLEVASSQGELWDIVICDPPSFAPSESAVPQASAAYRKLLAASAKVTRRGGMLAAASCSSHIPESLFVEICQEAVSDARRRATVLTITGQPIDHPAPLICPEFRYLKFVLLRLE
ncbi:MAG: class I SAM-dependent rRNA methyltransferase [Planctomycetota bacterium]|nr:MAG: class I SAM-dependent rRNA methyltransferase [Planctomycetota bacterium]